MSQYSNNAILSAREDINDELSIFRVKPITGEIPDYQPGQYAELAIVKPDEQESAGKLIRRSYSIASAPRQRGELEFYIVKVADGYFTPQLFALKPGDELWLGPKIKGKFTLDDVPTQKNLIMVATGTGLAPFLSMLRQYGDNPPWRKVGLIHGARYQRDLGYREELSQMAKDKPWFSYIPSLTREPQGSEWQGLRGRVQQLFSNGIVEREMDEPLSAEMSHILLCGNPQMIDDLEVLLGERGLKPHKKKEPGNIHVERYW